MSIYHDQFTYDSTIKNDLTVKELLILIKKNPYFNEMVDLFNVKSIENEIVLVNGARQLMEEILGIEEKFQKVDIEAPIGNVNISKFDNEDIYLNILSETGITYNAMMYRNVRDEYFNIVSASKFFTFLIRTKQYELVLENWKKIQQIYSKKKETTKKFRLITKARKTFVRAITSVNRYFNYDIKFSLFTAIMVLHLDAKENGNKYQLDVCDVTDSQINIKFKFLNRGVSKDKNCKFIIEVSNDEIKKDAFKFKGIRKIQTQQDNEIREFAIKSDSLNSRIISIKHNVRTDTMMEEIKKLNNLDRIEKELMAEWDNMLKIKNPDQIKYLLFSKLEKAKNEDIKKYKLEIKKLNQRSKINDMYELLKLMGKIDILIDNSDIGAKEYLSYLFYEVLSNEKNFA